jgi:hypothetical protein
MRVALVGDDNETIVELLERLDTCLVKAFANHTVVY